jgi:hypothetical protein
MVWLGLHHVQSNKGVPPAIQYDTYQGVLCGWQHPDDIAEDGDCVIVTRMVG